MNKDAQSYRGQVEASHPLLLNQSSRLPCDGITDTNYEEYSASVLASGPGRSSKVEQKALKSYERQRLLSAHGASDQEITEEKFEQDVEP